MNRNIVRFAALSLLGAAFSTTALAASVPHTFVAGTTASAAEVNANFAALTAAVTALESKLGPQTMESLAGTYDYFEVKIDVDNLSATSKSMAGAATSGTVVLNADGTGQVDLSTSYRQLTFNAVVTGDNTVQLAFFNTPETNNDAITWSLANGVVTIPEAGSFVVVGQLLIQSIKNFEGQNGITILARR
ncbi:MAG: hypothetical protein HY899_14910 [Deltaproteobacteria bacterium]|nr:hypothetical protein [Deltaproteobacteria bacterium]